jgi:hypothetical protein
VQYLDMAVAEMNPPPRQVDSDADEHDWMNETFTRVAGGWHAWEDAAAGRQLDARGRETLDIHIDKLKPAAERVYEDLRLRLATAPPPPPTELDYAGRLKRWLATPYYGVVGGASLGGVLGGLFGEDHSGIAWFLALLLAVTFLPPIHARVPKLTYTRASGAFVVIATVTVVVSMLVGGLGIALVLFALLTLAFLLGQRTGT